MRNSYLCKQKPELTLVGPKSRICSMGFATFSRLRHNCRAIQSWQLKKGSSGTFTPRVPYLATATHACVCTTLRLENGRMTSNLSAESRTKSQRWKISTSFSRLQSLSPLTRSDFNSYSAALRMHSLRHLPLQNI